jgi:transcriptional regulator with XRE-family HTH domain
VAWSASGPLPAATCRRRAQGRLDWTDQPQEIALAHDRGVSTRERPADRGRRRAADALRVLGRDARSARVGAGLSLRAVATATGTSHQQLLRFERGDVDHVSIPDVGAWCATVGLDLALRAFPAGDAIRDAGQQRLLDRLRPHIHASLRCRTEVPLPIRGDLRAWDLLIEGQDWRVAAEAETVLDDLQALERRLHRKQRDGEIDVVILLVADTRRNRRAIEAAPASFAGFSRDSRATLRALRAGLNPGRSSIVFL